MNRCLLRLRFERVRQGYIRGACILDHQDASFGVGPNLVASHAVKSGWVGDPWLLILEDGTISAHLPTCLEDHSAWIVCTYNIAPD